MHKDFGGNQLHAGQKVIVVTGRYKEFKKRYVDSFTNKRVRLANIVDGHVVEILSPEQIAIYEW